MYNKGFKEELQEDGHFTGDLKKLRQKHQILCNLVGHADDFIRYHVAVYFVSCSILMCLVLYNILYASVLMKDPIILSMAIFWFMMGFIVLSIGLIGGALVNNVVSTDQ